MFGEHYENMIDFMVITPYMSDIEKNENEKQYHQALLRYLYIMVC